MRCFTSDTSVTPENELLANLLKNNEQIAKYGSSIVQRTHKVLLKAGFTPENSVTIIDKHPDLLRYKPKQIEDRLEMWHMAQFSQPQYYELFVQCPEILDFDDEQQIAKRYAQIQTIVHTPKNVWRLLMSCPNLLVDDMQAIEQKVDYILKNMEADVTDLVKSGALGLSLKTIKTRHILLVRLGIYKKRNWRASELNPDKNLRLFRIMDVSDEEFAVKTCGISVKELEAFDELYERELEEQIQAQEDYEDIDTDSEDESDDDDNNFDPRERQDYYDDRYELLCLQFMLKCQFITISVIDFFSFSPLSHSGIAVVIRRRSKNVGVDGILLSFFFHTFFILIFELKINDVNHAENLPFPNSNQNLQYYIRIV